MFLKWRKKVKERSYVCVYVHVCIYVYVCVREIFFDSVRLSFFLVFPSVKECGNRVFCKVVESPSVSNFERT